MIKFRIKILYVLLILVFLFSCSKEREAEIADNSLPDMSGQTAQTIHDIIPKDLTLIIDSPQYFPFMNNVPVLWQYVSSGGLFNLGREGILSFLTLDVDIFGLNQKWLKHTAASLARIYSRDSLLYIHDIYGGLCIYDFEGNLMECFDSPYSSIPVNSGFAKNSFISVLEDGYYLDSIANDSPYQKIPFESVQYAEILQNTGQLIIQSEDSLHLINLSDFTSVWSVHEKNITIRYSFSFNDHLYVWKNDLSLCLFSMANGLLMEETSYPEYELKDHHGLYSLLKSDKSWQIKKGQDDFFTLSSVSDNGGFLFAHNVLYLWTSGEGIFCLNPDNAGVFWNLKNLPENTESVSEWNDNLLVLDEHNQLTGFISTQTSDNSHWPTEVISLPEAALDLSADKNMHILLIENATDEDYVIQQTNSTDNPASIRLLSSKGIELYNNALYAGFSDTLVFSGRRGEKYLLEIRKGVTQAEKKMLFKIYKKNV